MKYTQSKVKNGKLAQESQQGLNSAEMCPSEEELPNSTHAESLLSPDFFCISETWEPTSICFMQH